MRRKLLFVINVDWFFLSHRLAIAMAAMKNGYEVHIATGITDKQDTLQSCGIHVHPLRLVRSGVGMTNTIHTLVDLLRIVRAVKPDVMHLVTIKPVLLGGVISRLLRVPALVSAVSGLGFVFMAEGWKARFRLRFVRIVYKLALGHKNQVVIFQNLDDLALLMSATHIPSSKTILIRGSGVDLTQYVATFPPNGTPVILFPSRLLADKGLREFVEAAQRLKAKGVVARFVLVGLIDVANPTSLTQAQIDAWVDSGAIECWGYRTDMPQVLANSSVVVLPSYREGLPKVLLEAAACARAVVTTDVPGCRDAITPGVTGLLVPVRNSERLAAAIEYLIVNRSQREAMGLAGRRLAEQEFDIRFVVSKHLALYQNLLS